MTSYTLYSQTGPVSPVQPDANPYTLGVQFTVSTACTLDGIWWYSATSAAALPQTIAVFLVSGQSLVHSESASWSGAAGSGWVFAAFTSPPSLSASTGYEACVLQDTSANWYSVDVAYWASGSGSGGITNGPLSAPNSSGATLGQNLYHAGATLAYPTTAAGGDTFWVDVQVTPGGSTSHTATAALTVTPSFSVVPEGGSTSHTATAALTVTPSFSAAALAVSYQGSSGGVDTYNVSYAGNGTGTQSMRVLTPSAPDTSYPHAFLWMLPVEPGQGTTFGDSIGTAVTLGAQNAYNLTCIQPGFPINPWYADDPLDPSISQESFMRALAGWAAAHLAVTGGGAALP